MAVGSVEVVDLRKGRTRWETKISSQPAPAGKEVQPAAISTKLGMPVLEMDIASFNCVRSRISNSYKKHPRGPVLLLHSPISTSIW